MKNLNSNNSEDDYRSENIRDSEMIDHLMSALEEGTDIGHYGRLVFIMVARFFLNEDEIIALLAKQPDMDEIEARAMLTQVEEHDYNPPRRERILEWQTMQDFPICPNAEDPNACNVYRVLRFPEGIYDQIGDFWEDKVEAQEG